MAHARRDKIFPGACFVWILLFFMLYSGSAAHSNPHAYALRLDGQDSWVETPYNLDFKDDFTVEAWVKPNDVDTWQSYVGLEGNLYPYIICVHDSGRVLFAYRREEAGETITYRLWSETELETGKWVHIAVNKENLPSGFIARLFVNGELEAERVILDSMLEESGNLWMSGFSARLRRKAFGLIGEVRVWNTARSMDEIQDNIDRELRGDEEGLAAYWKFDEG